MKSFVFAVSIALFLGAGAISTQAQDAAAISDVDDAITGIVPAQPATASSVVAVTKKAETREDWDLCPNPTEALGNVPASAEQLQADIDRYSLCVARAELLVQLEELKKGSEGSSVDAMALPGGGTPVPLTPEQTSDLIGDVPGASAANSDLPAVAAPAPDKITVQDVSGANGNLIARISNLDGDIETVKDGDKLSDGSVVTSITATQVSVSKDGKTQRLEWGK